MKQGVITGTFTNVNTTHLSRRLLLLASPACVEVELQSA
jgi:hypothetical protein